MLCKRHHVQAEDQAAAAPEAIDLAPLEFDLMCVRHTITHSV
jgi:hypothetical protein